MSANGTEIDYRVVDIAKGGCFLEAKQFLKPNTDVVLSFLLPGDLGALTINGKVRWVRWATKGDSKEPLGMAIMFDEMSPGIKKIFEAYLVYLRNKQIITVSKRIIEEFFGNQPTDPKGK